MTVFEVFNWSINSLKDHQIESPQLNAELLLAHCLNLTREDLYIHFHNEIEEERVETFRDLIQRRILGVPLQYILGHQEFWSIDFKVDPRVLIPRPETELLVEKALFILSITPFKRKPVVLEIGTGSGAVAIALVKEVKEIFLVATDISNDALQVAKENAKSSGFLREIQFVQANLFDPFHMLKGQEPFDLILSNPPYITTSEIGTLAREVREHEPQIAFNGGEDGLSFHRKIISQAPCYLRKGGWLLLEVGQGQAEKVSNLIEKEKDFLMPDRFQDLSGIERVVRAQRR